MGSDFPDIMWFNTFNRYVKHVFLSHFTNWKAETNRNGGSSYPGLSPTPTLHTTPTHPHTPHPIIKRAEGNFGGHGYVYDIDYCDSLTLIKINHYIYVWNK